MRSGPAFRSMRTLETYTTSDMALSTPDPNEVLHHPVAGTARPKTLESVAIRGMASNIFFFASSNKSLALRIDRELAVSTCVKSSQELAADRAVKLAPATRLAPMPADSRSSY